MDYSDFSRRRGELYKKIFEPSDEMVRKYSKIYAFTCANLRNLMPQVPKLNYEEFFKKTLFNQQVSALEQDVPEIINSVQLRGQYDFLLQDSSSRILCTFHLGSYRIINSILTKHNKDYAILTDSRVIKEQSQEFILSWQKINDIYKTNGKFEIFDAERRDVLLKIARFLKEGNRYLVVYLDGNTGVGGQRNSSDNDNLIEIPFLNGSIKSRKGIAFISHLLKVPIVPVLNYRIDDEITLHFFNEIQTTEYADKEEFCSKSMTKLYNNFVDYLLLYPNQWEGWFYIHYSLTIQSINSTFYLSQQTKNSDGHIFNDDQFDLFTYASNSKFILDRQTYKSHIVNESLYEFLLDLKKTRINFTKELVRADISAETINELIEHKILH